MERLESNYRVGLQTRELVIPSRDTNWQHILRFPVNTVPNKNCDPQLRG
jgi:adenine-specific DNA-methyltransferase